MTPAELMKAVLLAPADLLWNGGIGTYVKASTEDNLSVGDRANDAIRVNGEGASRQGRGGEATSAAPSWAGSRPLSTVFGSTPTPSTTRRVSTPPTTRSTSRFSLSEVVRSGGLDLEERNTFLASMTDEVADLVLRDNYEQNVLLGNARAQEHQMATVHERLMKWLEERGDLDRQLEFLPSEAELAQRVHDGKGLKSPEFSVLVAYAKLALKHDLLASALPDDPYFEATLADRASRPHAGAVCRGSPRTRCAERSSRTRSRTPSSTVEASPSLPRR